MENKSRRNARREGSLNESIHRKWSRLRGDWRGVASDAHYVEQQSFALLTSVDVSWAIRVSLAVGLVRETKGMRG